MAADVALVIEIVAIQRDADLRAPALVCLKTAKAPDESSRNRRRESSAESLGLQQPFAEHGQRASVDAPVQFVAQPGR